MAIAQFNMREIDSGSLDDIEQAITAGLVSLPPAVLEKDVHITDVLIALSRLELTHTAHRTSQQKGSLLPPTVEVGVKLVFAGGTCLSKAHKLIERMSEDIDIKVVLDDVPPGYNFPGGYGSRKRLKDLHSKVEELLLGMGFKFVEMEGDNPRIKDTHRYYCLAVSYKSRFPALAALRPQLKLEFIHRHPKLAFPTQEIGYLLNQFVQNATPAKFNMQCIAVSETLAEKVLSLLRRCAWKWDGYQTRELDQALVRHIYDVWRIASLNPNAIDQAIEAFACLVETDSIEFKGQHPEFDTEPYRVLLNALSTARTSGELRQNFQDRLVPLLFEGTTVDFDTCFGIFEEIAMRCLRTIQPA